MIATGDIGAEKGAGLQGNAGESPTRVGSRRPREDVIVTKRTELTDEFKDTPWEKIRDEIYKGRGA